MSEKRPLFVATDDSVREEVLRVAAAVGREIEHVPDLVAAAERWMSAPIVLVDTEALTSFEPNIRQRSETVLVCYGNPAGDVWERAFTSGIRRVIVLPDNETELVSLLADDVDDRSDAQGAVLAVIGARGGAGSSVLAGAVAARAARDGTSTLLVDCDALGGGLDLLFGLERRDGLRWPGLVVNSGRVAMSDLHAALPEADIGSGRLSVLSCGRSGGGPAPDAVRSVIDAGRRSGEIVVCDLDRAIGPAARVAVGAADAVLMVVPSEVRACAAAARVVARLEEYADRNVLRVVGRVSGPDGLYDVDIADALQLPLLGTLRHEKGVSRALERGEYAGRTRGSLAAVARAALAELPNRTVERAV